MCAMLMLLLLLLLLERAVLLLALPLPTALLVSVLAELESKITTTTTTASKQNAKLPPTCHSQPARARQSGALSAPMPTRIGSHESTRSTNTRASQQTGKPDQAPPTEPSQRAELSFRPAAATPSRRARPAHFRFGVKTRIVVVGVVARTMQL